MNANWKPLDDEMLISASLDGELSAEDQAMLEKRLLEIPELAESAQKMKGVSEAVQSATLELSDYEKQQFDIAFARRLKEETSAVPKATGWLGRWSGISWQWQAAAALMLMLLCYLPFIEQAEQGLTVPSFETDLSNTTISQDSNEEAGFDLILVVTEEEEPEEIQTPLGLLPLKKTYDSSYSTRA